MWFDKLTTNAEGGEMKAGWKMKVLGDVCDKASSNVSQNKLHNEIGEYPIFGASGLIKNVSFYHQDKPYLSIVKDGSGVGRVTKMSAFTSVIGTLQYILPNDEIYLDYLNYSLMSVDFKKYVAGAAIPHIYFKDYKNEPFLWMPLPEQQRTVAILDQAFEGIAKARANAEQNLQNARALFESHLQSVFSVRGELVEGRGESWINATLGQYIKFIDYRGKTPEKTEGGLRLITAKNVKMGYLQINPREYVAPKIYDSWMTRGIPRLGDVLFTTEAPLANVAQLDTDEKVVFAQRIIIMQPDASKLDSTFLKYMLLSEPIQKRIHDKGTGATVKGIKASLLKNIQISFPNSVSAQAKIVDKFDALSAETQRLEALYQRKIALLDELKKSLLQQAFAGEL